MNRSTVHTKHNGELVVINTTAVDTLDVAMSLGNSNAIAEMEANRAMVDALSQWVQRTKGSTARRRARVGSLIDRDRWLMPEFVPDQIRLARTALTDDIISTAADGTEAFAFGEVNISTDDEDEESVWNQWAADFNLDDQLRKAWNILFTDGQFCAVTWWGSKDYVPQGIRNKAPKRSKISLMAPVGMTYLDVTKVIPCGNLMFGQERLAYHPTVLEAMRIERVLAARDDNPYTMPDRVQVRGRSGRWKWIDVPAHADELELDDPLIQQLIVKRYHPDFEEIRLLEEDGIDPTYLYEMNPKMCFRHTLTRPDYQRFGRVPLAACFELLDLKAQLRQLDRTLLVGAAHFILLIRKGSEKHPAEQPEISALQQQAVSMASVPVIVGDYRLQVDIITPKTDNTLDRGRYDTIDARLFDRVWSAFHHDVSRTEDPLKMARVISKNLENRRKMLKRTFEREIFQRIHDDSSLKGRATMEFVPANIALAFDAAYAAWIADLRAANELSRFTTLGQFDLDEEKEARYRRRERESGLDDEFMTQQPHGTPNPMNANGGGAAGPYDGPGGDVAAQRAAGRSARGGGAAPGSGQGDSPRNPHRLANPDTPTEAAKDLVEMNKTELLDVAAGYEIRGRSRMGRPQLRNAIRRARMGVLQDELEEE